MNRLISTNSLAGCKVHETDGEIGRVEELYFDDAEWIVRYVVVDVRSWLPGRKVLVPPSFVSEARIEDHELRVALTRKQVRDCPDSSADLPVVLQRIAEKKAPLNWAISLAGEALLSVPEAWAIPPFDPTNRGGRPFDTHLRTTRVVAKLALWSQGQMVGGISDFLVDESTWAIRYLVVDLPDGRRVRLPPQHVRSIVLNESFVDVDLAPEAISALSVDAPSMESAGRFA